MSKGAELRLTRADLLWSYAAQFLQYGAQLLVLPVLLSRLSAQEVGIWYAFSLAGMMTSLLDFGFQSAFVRNVAYVASGARSLEKEGTQKLQAGGEIDYPLLASVIAVARGHYRRISAWILVALLTGGSAYVSYVAADYPAKGTLAAAWLIFAVGTAHNFYWTYLGPCLNGLRAIKKSQQADVIGRLTGVAGSIAGLCAGWGLVGAVTGFIAGSVAYPLAARFFLTRHPDYRRAAGCGSTLDTAELAKTLWHNAKKQGAVAVGVFLVIRATALMASLFLPLESFATYALTLQVIQVPTTLARVKLNASLPILSALVAKDELERFRQQFWSAMRLGWVLYLLCAAGMVVCGDAVLGLMGSHSHLLGTPQLFLVALIYLMEITHGNAATALTCFNRVPYVAATWGTGIAIVAGSLVVVWCTDLGVLGLLLVQLVSQAAYNAWKWPLEIHRKISQPAQQGIYPEVAPCPSQPRS